MTGSGKATPQATIVAFDRSAPSASYASAVSLHAHTHYSSEVMAGVSPYVERIPVVSRLIRQEANAHRRRSGQAVDDRRGWWHPPQTPAGLYASETRQIRILGCEAMVSMTDHDSIAAPLELRRTHGDVAPISFEWTVPLGPGFLHLGVHNLRAADAEETFRALSAFTHAERSDTETLSRRLADLSTDPDTLVVLNHPLWDISGVGGAAHASMVDRFIDEQGDLVHAVELNGMRDEEENGHVAELAASHQFPLVSGGDRHGRSPNCVLNLTNARSFGAFAREVRDEKRSVVLLMPEYRRPLVYRKLETAAEVLRTYPDHPEGLQLWVERVTYERHGVVRRLSDHWPTGGPLWVRAVLALFQLATSRPMLPITGTLAQLLRRRPRQTTRPAPAFAIRKPTPTSSPESETIG